MHGTIFKLTLNALVPFEFIEGPSPLAASLSTPPTFLVDFVAYLTKHDLANQLALEVKDFSKYNVNSYNPIFEFKL